MSNDIFHIDEVYSQFIHVIDAKDERDIRRNNMERCLGQSMANWEYEMNNIFGVDAFYAKAAS